MFYTRGMRGWVWPGLLAACIVFASSNSHIASPDIPNFDKVGHAGVFALLATLVVRNGFVPRFGWLAVLMVSFFGVTDEWHQSFTPGRSVEFADWLADTLGATVAVLLYANCSGYRRLLEGKEDSRVETAQKIAPTDRTP